MQGWFRVQLEHFDDSRFSLNGSFEGKVSKEGLSEPCQNGYRLSKCRIQMELLLDDELSAGFTLGLLKDSDFLHVVIEKRGVESRCNRALYIGLLSFEPYVLSQVLKLLFGGCAERRVRLKVVKRLEFVRNRQVLSRVLQEGVCEPCICDYRPVKCRIRVNFPGIAFCCLC